MSVAISTAAPDVIVRWMVTDDILPLLSFAGDAGVPLWTHDEFQNHFRSTDTIGKVAEVDGTIIGFLMYRLDQESAEVVIENLAVVRHWRRQGVGTSLLRSVDRKLSQGFDRIVVLAPESNLPMQLFLRDCGFRATNVLRRWYEDEDAYRMERVTAPAREFGLLSA